MEKWHAAKPKSIANGVAAPAKPARPARPAPPQYTKVFGEALVEEVRRDRRVVGITAAMNSGTGLNLLQKAEPDHYFDVGIAEQQAVLFAAGLALEGAKPVCAIYSTFLQRAFDQIVHDVCLQKLNVVFAMDRAGLVGDDGPTHHGVFDIAYLRCAAQHRARWRRATRRCSCTCCAPRSTTTTGPFALRYPRGEGVGVPLPRDAVKPIRDRHRRDPARGRRRVALVGYGSGVAQGARGGRPARRAAASTSRSPTRASPSRSTPRCWPQLAAEHELLVTVEEGVLAGGFGSAVWETLNDARHGRRPAHPARRPARPLRDARQAGAAARRGRLHRPGASPSGSRRRSPSARRRDVALLRGVRLVERSPRA